MRFKMDSFSANCFLFFVFFQKIIFALFAMDYKLTKKCGTRDGYETYNLQVLKGAVVVEDCNSYCFSLIINVLLILI